MSDALKWVVAIAPEPRNAEKVMAILLEMGFRVLSQYGPRIGTQKENELFSITNDEMNQCANSTEIIKYWNEVKNTFDLIKIHSGEWCDLGPIGRYYENIDTGWKPWITLTGTVMLPIPDIPYREPTLEEQRETEEFNKKLLRASLKNASVRKVLELQKMGHSGTILGSIFELIREDMKRDLYSLISEKQRKRFTLSINHPDVFGLGRSRHGVGDFDPPPNPMDEGQAKYFIDDLVRRWIILVAQTS